MSIASGELARSGTELLVDWANEQDGWIRELVAEIIDTRRLLGDPRAAHYFDLFLREKQLASGDFKDVGPLSVGSAVTRDADALVLTRLTHHENVNALAPNQEIAFSPRMTVLFGENGSGKTGYVRILKAAAAVRTAEAVLPDIRGCVLARTPRASLEFRLGTSDSKTREWRGERGLEPFTRVDVFDSRAAVVHVDDDLSYAYTPAELALFPLVHEGIELVRATLEARQRERQPAGNPFASRFPRDSRMVPKIEMLGASTDLNELEALASVTEEEAAALPGLREKVEALRSGNLNARLQVARRERDACTRAAEIAEAVSAFDPVAYSGALSSLRTAESAHLRATEDAFSTHAIPGALSSEWRTFIEAGEEYIRASVGEPFPSAGAPCIYCQQPLADAAVSLVRKYREFRNDALRAAVDAARERLSTATAMLSATSPGEVLEELDRIAASVGSNEQLAPQLTIARSVVEMTVALRVAIGDSEEWSPPSSFDPLRAALELRSHAADLSRIEEQLRLQGEDRQRALVEQSAMLRDLEDRLALRSVLSGIRSHVEAARWVDRAGSQLKRFQGIKRGLTETSKRASAEVLNREFEKHFAAECSALRAPRVGLDFPGREGEAKRRKVLTPDHGLSEVLSEGEQKVIALADFLAEASLKPGSSPLVLDDPITSLDHKRIQHVVERVVEISRSRQVIVFTHDIWFAAELLAQFEREPKEQFAFYDVLAEGDRIGAVARSSAPRTDSFKDRSRRIEAVIAEGVKSAGEARQALVEKGYEQLRGACELVVEVDILKGVTERYRPNVRMTVLPQIRADRLPEAVATITPIFERCCRLIASHSQPLATLGIRPTLDELRADWDALKEARSRYLA